MIKCFQSWRCPSEAQVAVYTISSCLEKEEGVFILKFTEMSEVRQHKHRQAETSQSRTQIFHKHMEVAVELALDSKCNFLSAISPQKKETEKEWFNF